MIMQMHVHHKVKEIETVGHNTNTFENAQKYIFRYKIYTLKNIPSIQENLLWSDLTRTK